MAARSSVSMASLWNNNQQDEADHQESFIVSNSKCCNGYGAKIMDPTEDIFYPIQVLQKAQISQLNSHPDERPGLDHATSLAAITSWQDTISTQMSSCPYVTSRPLGNLVAAAELYGMEDQSQVVNNIIALQNGKPAAAAAAGISTTCSLESLDCLLSANNNSNTADTTSIEDDDGISILFSDCCSNLWNFGANNNNSAVSSESETNAPNNIARNKDNELDQETVSHGSLLLDPYNVKNGGIIIQEERPCSTKRKIYHQSEQFHLLQGTDTRITTDGGFKLISEKNPPRTNNKKPRLEKQPIISSSNINFQQESNNNNNSSVSNTSIEEPDPEAIAQMKEMIYRAAAFRPVNLGLDDEVVEKPKRKNVRISNDPQTVAARQRRERISERIRVLQRLVPGGTKMDTASMLDEAANYLKFLRSQVKALESHGHHKPDTTTHLAFSSLPPFNNSFSMQTHFSLQNPNHIPPHPQI